MRTLLLLLFLITSSFPSAIAQSIPVDQERKAFKETFRDTVERIEANRSLKNIKKLTEWTNSVETRRKQLAEMLGLDPMPQKTDLKAETRGTVEAEDFVVEKVLYQSKPGLYVTANFYRPKQQDKPRPAILYVCGHARAKEGDRSYGNKTPYHHHAVWYVRHGYVALVIDTLQLGEIEGLHHGTYGIRKNGKYEKQWWWISRGYTPAGVEAWNGIRSVDYLISRKEVDPDRIGITGRSGGGAYSWYTAALDTRIKAVIPVAGITDLRNHVVDGVVAGHCDCMYMVNTYQWDYPELAALIAPRALMIQNTDSDSIFPLDGVARIHDQLKHLYKLYKQEQNLRLFISPGPHKDTQALQEQSFAWFDHHLRDSDEPITDKAEKIFEYKQLAVLEKDPADQINKKIQETFVPQNFPPVPKNIKEWQTIQRDLRKFLNEKVFAGCPKDLDAEFFEKVSKKTKNDKTKNVSVTEYTVEFRSEASLPLVMKIVHMNEGKLQEPNGIVLKIQGGKSNQSDFPWDIEEYGIIENPLLVSFYPRGRYLDSGEASEREVTQIKRRFYLTGQTLSSMRVYDSRRAIHLLHKLFPKLKNKPVHLTAISDNEQGTANVIALYTAILEPSVKGLWISSEIPESSEFLNVLKHAELKHLYPLVFKSAEIASVGKNGKDAEKFLSYFLKFSDLEKQKSP